MDKKNVDELREAQKILNQYKAGKANLESKIVLNEQFWKLRHWEHISTKRDVPATGWLWNVIVSKHADLQDGYPEPNILAREEGDKPEAEILTSIVPVVMEQNEFKKTYSDCNWYKLKNGCSVYGVFWDGSKLGGLGDIAIKKIDLLNLFWEPGISNIQQSRNLFHVELVDKDVLREQYPDIDLDFSGFDVTKYIYDESIDTSEKAAVVDWYFRKDGKLHFVKYCGETILYDSREKNPDGWYDHGKYPFVFDSLFDIEGSPCGYGYTDICKDTQINIDRLNCAIVDNAVRASKIRYFIRGDGQINENEFADWNKDFVHFTGANLTDENIRQIQVNPLNGLYVEILNNQIEMLKQTSGSTDASNGIPQSGITAASAIAALQEASGKTSRDMIQGTYDAYKEICYFVIELIRQFYTTDRQFRITGVNGEQQFVLYNNSGISAVSQDVLGMDMGYRVPQFDIEVSVQKASAYSKLAQNEFALQLYSAGVLSPQNADTALRLLDLMDFKGRSDLISKLQQDAYINQQMALSGFMPPQDAAPTGYEAPQPEQSSEGTRMAKARQTTQESTQPRL